MPKVFALRLDESLLECIDGYAKSKEMNRSDGIRNLIELGLKVNDIRDADSPDIDAEFKKILLEIYLTNSQIFLHEKVDIDPKILKKNNEMIKERIKKKYPLIDDKYSDFLHQNKKENSEDNVE